MHILAPVRKRLERYKARNWNWLRIFQMGRITASRAVIHALVHLMDNAFKFSFEKGQMRLTVQRGSNGGVNILVQDDGPGIPLELREKVFEQFYQASQGDRREYEGLGVGLTIARAIFRSLNGDVQILDSPMGCWVSAFIPEHGPDDIVYG